MSLVYLQFPFLYFQFTIKKWWNEFILTPLKKMATDHRNSNIRDTRTSTFSRYPKITTRIVYNKGFQS